MSSDQHPLDPARDRWFLGTLMRFHATRAETGGAVSVVEQRAPAGFSPPLHVHANEDAVLVVLEGALTVQVGDVRRTLLPSESVFLPRRVPHTFRADVPSRILEVTTPGGSDEFYAENGVPAARRELPPAEPIDMARLTRSANARNMEHLGPPLVD
jgi:quercetin dioxygenase-like cupin family protein